MKLSLSGVCKRFRAASGDVTVLEGIRLDVADREFVSLVGASGCGKSTLLSIIAGLTDYEAGTVMLDGREIDGPGLDRGVVFQSYTLLPWLTALENVQFAVRAAGASRSEALRAAREHLALVNLTAFADRYPKELSGGMQQRVAIARTLSYRPAVVLMDEPFGALDALTRAQMQELLTQIWEAHKMTVVFVTHDVEEAVFLSDRVCVMASQPGRIKATFAIDLARPRVRDVHRAPRMVELQEDILACIRQDGRGG